MEMIKKCCLYYNSTAGRNFVEIIRGIYVTITLLFLLCYAYQIGYILVPFFKKHKAHKMEKEHNLAVLIAARNEEKVIGHLIHSIKQQTYNQDNITVFVIADNCTDQTAQVAEELGAVVYKRFNKMQVGKGYALEYLLDRMKEDFEPFDGYFVFDADNVLDKNYIKEMNQTFSDGYEIITSYRNSKNYEDNWITAGYGLWFLRESKFLNEARMLLGTSCAVSGTGFMFSHKILEKHGGWKFFLLTEDIEFTVKNIVAGEKVGYCKDAILYDEQPVLFSQSWKQRLRWAKGYYQVFQYYGANLGKGAVRGSFSCCDMMMTIMPAIVITLISVFLSLLVIVVGDFSKAAFLLSSEMLWELARNMYGILFFVGFVTTITEWKSIHASVIKKILYMFTFPIFMLTYIPISITAFFKKVEWVPIEHSRVKSLAEITEEC